MKDNTVITSLLSRFSRAVDRLVSRPATIEGMGVLTGETGQGKTTAVVHVANRIDAVYVRARTTWSARSLLESIVDEFGRSPTHALDPMVRLVVQILREEQRVLLVDEADYLLRPTRAKAEPLALIRDIYDEAQTPVVLIGSPDLSKKLKTSASLHKHARRVSEWVEFDGISGDDARRIALEMAEIEIEPALVTKMFKEAAGNVAAFVSSIHAVESFAEANGLDAVSLSQFGNRHLHRPSRYGFIPSHALI